jgi:hypothetical protein
MNRNGYTAGDDAAILAAASSYGQIDELTISI